MAQHPEQRRLVRLAASMNGKARRLGVPGQVTPEELMMIVIGSPTCQYCGVRLPEGQGSFDHMVPFDRGGANRAWNIARSCVNCNRRKFTKTPDEMAGYANFTVRCERPGCDVWYHPRYAEWQAGRARLCSRRCSALLRHMRERGEV